MPDDFAHHLAEDLINARTEKGLNQMFAAELSNLSVREYQHIEKGLRIPRADHFLRMVYFLDLDVENYREELTGDVLIPPR